jgi:polysaccharide biosynthesis/export protein
MKKNIYLFIIPVILFALFGSAYAEEYVIGDEDMLQISIWGNPELSVTVPVRPDGMISIPLVGDVKASGLTPQELKKTLEKDLARFIKTPVATVMVTAINSFKVYVFGDGVSRTQPAAGGQAGGAPSTSGQITLHRHTTLLQLLTQFGSLSDVNFADAYLMRNGSKLKVDFEQLVAKGDVTKDVELEANDLIYLPGGLSSRIRVIGEVKTPSLIPYFEGITALDAVLSAGGFTDFASKNDVLIVRREGNVVSNIEVKLKDVMNGNLKKNVYLKPGDIVTVKSSIF